MTRRWRGSSYHAWPSSTPVIDVVVSVLAMASVVIGAHATLFLALALSVGDTKTAAANALFFVGIGAANGSVEALRHWRRHHA